jgi:hypothetical protein
LHGGGAGRLGPQEEAIPAGDHQNVLIPAGQEFPRSYPRELKSPKTASMARSLNRAIRAWSASPSLSMGGGAVRGHGNIRPSRHQGGHRGSRPRKSRAATAGPNGRSLVPAGGLASRRVHSSSGPSCSSSSSMRRDRASNRWEGRPARGPKEEHGSRPDGEPWRPARTGGGLRPTAGARVCGRRWHLSGTTMRVP